MDDSRTVWCGNLSDQVTEELLYELFLQAGPLERVRIPTDKGGKRMNYGFVTFKHEMSIEYALKLFRGTCLFDKFLNIQYRNKKLNESNNLHTDLFAPIIPKVTDTFAQNSPSEHRERQWNNRVSDRDNRHRGRCSPYERNDYYDNRNDSSNRRQYPDLRRALNDRRRNTNWY